MRQLFYLELSNEIKYAILIKDFKNWKFLSITNFVCVVYSITNFVKNLLHIFKQNYSTLFINRF